MHTKNLFVLPAAICCFSCNGNTKADTTVKEVNKTKTVASIGAIPIPDGFTRVPADSNSFGTWLRKVILKKDKTVYLYNGETKANQEAQYAVLDISVGSRDLQQCADAVMRLRAEYLFEQKKFDSIFFKDNEGGEYRFDAPYTHEHLLSFLQRVFGMCGSASLAKQLQPGLLKNIQPGDVIIRGGFPGHAVLVMDVAKNEEGKIVYLLAQSYMPAQDIHVLINPFDKELSPWYAVNEEEKIYTPEYTFTINEVKRW